jgi:hypothetical protein
MTPSDAAARVAIQHFIVHEGEIGDIVWPLPEARCVVGLWLDAAGDAANIRWVEAEAATEAWWDVFHTDPTEGHQQFVTVEGVAPNSPDLLDAVAAAVAGTARPVLLLNSEPDKATAVGLRNAGWRLTDARQLVR